MQLDVISGNAQRWLGRIVDTMIPNAVNDTLSSDTAIEKIRSSAESLLSISVYDNIPPGDYNRTGALRDSVIVGRGKNGEVELGLDAGRSPTIAGNAAGANSYGIFMLPEMASRSFLQRTAPDTIPRPFLDSWMMAFSHVLPQQLREEMDRRIR